MILNISYGKKRGDYLQVINSNGEVEKFKPSKIKNKLLSETDLTDDEANLIANSVARILREQYTASIADEKIPTGAIRAMVNAQLIKRGFIDEEIGSRKLGLSKSDFENLLVNGNRDNANIQYSPEMIAKYASDAISKEYALLTMPKHCSEAHIEGYVHHHDLEYFNTRPNCMNFDLRFFAKNGLKIDGKGKMGSVAKPAKSLEVLLNHMQQAFMAGAVVFSGGQGFANFNTLLAPYAKGRSYKEIKQAIQAFIFNCNMALVCRGGQVLFSSIGMDLSTPEVLANEPAVTFGGIEQGVYADYKEEADLIFKAVCEVIDEKDGNGAYHRFPNTLFNIREGDLDKYEGNCKLLHELGANNPTIYYVNCTKEESTVMGALSSDTPVMTDKGFKYPYELKIGDTVMTYSSDGSKCWNKIYNVIEKDIPSKLFKITCDNGYSFKVTDNHKLPTSNGIVKSENLKVGMELYNYIDEVFNPTDDYEAEFIGVFLADGFIRHKPKHQKNGNDIEFHITKKWKLNTIISLCEKLDYNYKVVTTKNNSYNILVKEKELRDKLVKLYDDNLGVKKFPTEYWNDKNKLANIIKGLMFDGRVENNNRFCWSCSSKELVYDFCYAISLLGFKSTIYEDIRNNWKPNYMIRFGLNYNPKNTTKIKSIELVDNTEPVYDLSIENNHNYVCGLGGIHSENCRTRLPMNYAYNYADDCLNTGNFMYSTLNLPLIAHQAVEEHIPFYTLLDHYCNIVYDTLKFRRSEVEKVLYEYHMSDFLLQKDKDTGKPLYDLDRCTYTIGFCGLNEALIVLEDADDDYDGESIVKRLNMNKEMFNKRDGLRWSVIASPAESTAHRFALINKKKYPNSPVQGTKKNCYLTNSSHIPVSNPSTIVDHIKNADKYHPLTGGGNILHIWLGEVWSDAEALWKLNKKIIETGTIFWAYSKVFTFCQECGFTINDNLTVCPICGSKNLNVYDRITGYYICIDGYNDGKRQEQKERYRQSLG